MKISLITATYQSAATVRDTLRSVADQRGVNIEHLIIDGGSTDDTLRIVSEFPHVARLVSEKDKGIYDAMNKGLSLATGDIIGIINSDDVYTHDHVIADVMRLFEDPQTDTVYGDLQYVQPDNLEKVTRTWKAGPFVRSKFYFGWMPPHPTFFVRRHVYESVGSFNLSLQSSADYELMLRVLVKHRFNAVYLPELLVKMRTGGMSNATLGHRIRANREDRRAWEINGMKPYFFTLPFKPLRKIFQFFIK